MLLLQYSLQPGLFASDPFSLDQISERFPYQGFEQKIEFWKAVFSRYGEKEILIHDEEDPRLIYEVVRFERGVHGNPAEYQRQRNVLRNRQRELQQSLDQIRVRGIDSEKLERKHQEIIELLKSHGYSPSPALFRELQQRIRYQRGIKEKFREGLIRAGLYLNPIEEIFRKFRLPTELTLLPHVESSFDYRAYSKRGAAGVWQFMPTTGRRFLEINSQIDERLDPLRSAEAAARLLQENYEVLGSWPLAITAFNHGQNGMLRAKKQFGSDLVKIVQHYRSRIFGFASKNFYSEFLAAVDVARNSKRYFGDLQIDSPLRFDTVHLERSYPLDHLAKVPGLSEDTLQAYNPQIMPYVWTRSKVLPAGLYLRIPEGHRPFLMSSLKSAPSVWAPGEVISASDGSTQYRVQYGDNLSSIASTFGASIAQLQNMNNIGNPNRIYPGQLLLINGASERPGQYRVRRGDTLERIAQKFGVSLPLLQSANEIDNPHKIFLGQILLIP